MQKTFSHLLNKDEVWKIVQKKMGHLKSHIESLEIYLDCFFIVKVEEKDWNYYWNITWLKSGSNYIGVWDLFESLLFAGVCYRSTVAIFLCLNLLSSPYIHVVHVGEYNQYIWVYNTSINMWVKFNMNTIFEGLFKNFIVKIGHTILLEEMHPED